MALDRTKEVGLNTDTIKSLSGLVTEPRDFISLTYVSAGDGAGEIETVTYKDGGSGGATVAVLTLAYDINDRLLTITRT
jgi:hypothetical protein